MWAETIRQIKISFSLLLFFTLLTGIIYPLAVTGLAQLFFPEKANGSLLQKNGVTIGSQLIGQSFTNLNYFWGRPSATTPFPNNAENSGGSNFANTNADFLTQVKNRIADLQKTEITNHRLIPVDLVTSSASGLDPEISPFAAYFQVQRIAKARNISEKEVYDLIQKTIQPRTLGILGEPRVNVLQLNLALDNR